MSLPGEFTEGLQCASNIPSNETILKVTIAGNLQGDVFLLPGTAIQAAPLDPLKNNQILTFLAPQVFSHCCDTQKQACKKMAIYILFKPSHNGLKF